MPIDPKLLDAMAEAIRSTMANGCSWNAGICEMATCICAKDAVFAALRAAETWPVPHKLVGREATEDMRAAMMRGIKGPNIVWSAAFDAAPGVVE